jgi:Ser/Thr protein kinase RdoA (MazF antagonist)
MKFLRTNAPTFPLDQVQQFAHVHFGLTGNAQPLYSERDQNTVFREKDGSGWIVKIANTDEDPLIIDCQSEALAHIQRIDPSIPVPRIRLTTDRGKTAKVRSDRGSDHILYALSFLEGQIAEKIELRTPLLHRVGAMQARLGKSLGVFFIPRPAEENCSGTCEWPRNTSNTSMRLKTPCSNVSRRM